MTINRYIIIFVSALAFYVSAVWLQQKLPANDDASNLSHAYTVVQNFQSNSTPLLQQMAALYWERGFRPNLFNPVSVLLMLLTGSDFKLSQLILTILEFLLFALAIYYIFSRSFVAPNNAYLAGLILFLPWVFHGFTIFSSEGMGLVFFAWSIFYIHKVDFQLFEEKFNRKYLFFISIMAGFMVASKPVEGVLIFLPLLILLCISYVDSKKVIFTLFAIFCSLLFPILYCYSIYTNAIWHNNAPILFWILSLLYLVCTSMLLCYFFNFLINTFLLIIPCALLSYFWFGPFTYSTLKWALDASLGSVARETGGRGDLSAFNFLLYAFNSLFGYIFCLVLCYFILFRKVWTKIDVILLISFSIPLLAGAISYNNDLRYYMYTGLGFILVILNGTMRTPSSWLKYFTQNETFIFQVLLVLFLFHTGSVFQFWQPLPLLNKPAFGLSPNLIYLEKDLTRERIKVLNEQFNFSLKNNFCLLQMPSRKSDFHIDPWISTILLSQMGYKTLIIRPVPHNLSTTKERFDLRVKNECCYVAIFPLNYDHAPPTHSLNDVGEWFLMLYEKNSLKDVEFQFSRKINLAPYKPDFDMLVFKNTRTDICSY